MSFVLDASVALAWCFEDEQTPDVLALLDRVVETGAFAPLLWPVEVLNVLLVAERRQRIDRHRRAKLADFLRDLPIALDPELAGRVWEDTVALAERFQLTVYDAAYLELALRRRLPLGSLDRDLRAAAGGLGVVVLG